MGGAVAQKFKLAHYRPKALLEKSLRCDAHLSGAQAGSMRMPAPAERAAQ
jgi:hypothetical protein